MTRAVTADDLQLLAAIWQAGNVIELTTGRGSRFAWRTMTIADAQGQELDMDGTMRLKAAGLLRDHLLFRERMLISDAGHRVVAEYHRQLQAEEIERQNRAAKGWQI